MALLDPDDDLPKPKPHERLPPFPTPVGKHGVGPRVGPGFEGQSLNDFVHQKPGEAE